MAGTILFGVDVESLGDNSLGYARSGTEMYHELQVPVTYFLIGTVIEEHPEVWAELERDPLIFLEAHTYAHLLLKTVCRKEPPAHPNPGVGSYTVFRGGSLQEIEDDLAKCVDVFTQVIGRPPRGLTGPYGYWRGLQDRPDILEIVASSGFQFLRTFARDQWDGQPVPVQWAPFFYESQGYPDILECFVHDFQDDFLWSFFTQPGPEDRYIDRLKLTTDKVVAQDLVWSAASHDHGCGTPEGFEKKASWIREWITYAKERGVRFMSYQDFYDEKLSER